MTFDGRTPRPAPAAPAKFIGLQRWPGRRTYALYNLTADIPGHREGSTVSRETLADAGYLTPLPKKP